MNPVFSPSRANLATFFAMASIWCVSLVLWPIGTVCAALVAGVVVVNWYLQLFFFATDAELERGEE